MVHRANIWDTEYKYLSVKVWICVNMGTDNYITLHAPILMDIKVLERKFRRVFFSPQWPTVAILVFVGRCCTLSLKKGTKSWHYVLHVFHFLLLVVIIQFIFFLSALLVSLLRLWRHGGAFVTWLEYTGNYGIDLQSNKYKQFVFPDSSCAQDYSHTAIFQSGEVHFAG